MKVEIRVFRASGEVIPMSLNPEGLFDKLRSIVGGYIVPVRNEEGLSAGKVILANEDGFALGLPANPHCEGLVGDFIVMDEKDLEPSVI